MRDISRMSIFLSIYVVIIHDRVLRGDGQIHLGVHAGFQISA